MVRSADNDDGITVVDITDPSQPAYCFMHPSQVTPLSAYEYLRCYYDLPNLCRGPGAAGGGTDPGSVGEGPGADSESEPDSEDDAGSSADSEWSAHCS